MRSRLEAERLLVSPMSAQVFGRYPARRLAAIKRRAAGAYPSHRAVMSHSSRTEHSRAEARFLRIGAGQTVLVGGSVVDTVTLDAIEFTFFPVGLADGNVAHRAMFVGTLALPVVVIYRADGKKSARIAFDVPRDVAKAKHYDNHADVVRDAIGQANRDNLFNHPPEATQCLADDAPRWRGNLQLAHT